MKDLTKDAKIPARVFELKKAFFEIRPAICLEAAKAKTDVFRETEGEPYIIRRAKAFKRHCETKTVRVLPHELIVGNAGSLPRTACIPPELTPDLIDELDTVQTRSQDPFDITEEQKKLYREYIYPYWKDRTLASYFFKQLPPFTREIVETGGILDPGIKYMCPPGDMVPAFPYIFEKGIGGIRKEAEEGLARLDLARVAQDYDKKHFLESVILCCDGLGALFRRYGDACLDEMAHESDDARKAELRLMGEGCRRIATEPPSSFLEAVQLVYFVLVALHIEGNAGGYSPGRLDQYLYPFYRADFDKGVIDNSRALEILGAYWVKSGEQNWFYSAEITKHYAGMSGFHNTCLGGTTVDGLDAANELSYLMLQATIDLQMMDPSLSVRLSRRNHEDFFLKVAECVQTGTGFPSIHSDTVGTETAMTKGIPPQVAKDWAPIGCVEVQAPGMTYQWSSSGHYNLGTVVEYALSDGIHRKTGKRFGLQTGDPTSFETYEQFHDAVYRQIDFTLEQFNVIQSLLEVLHYNYLQCPVASMFTLDCVANARDLTHGGARYNTGPGINGNGVADFADSLAAVKKLVFEEKKIPMSTLVAALENDFVGYEDVRAMLIEQAPKWGNDDPYVDGLQTEMCQYLSEKCRSYRGLLGNPKLPALYPVSSNVPQGMAVGALPSGRKAYTPLADGCSPSQGRDRKGPTSVLKSLSYMPHTIIDGGTLLNMKFSPSSVAGMQGRHRLSAFLKTFLDLDIFHIQFNVVGHQVLRCAQQHPEDYKSLIVRVAGYSAYFVDLSREVQEDVIARTVHEI